MVNKIIFNKVGAKIGLFIEMSKGSVEVFKKQAKEARDK